MKKSLIIGIIIAIVIIGLGIYFYPSPTPSNCAQEGEQYSSGGFPPEITEECCEGLSVIQRGNIYEPTNEYADKDGCIYSYGAGTICSDCGNGVCEEWENPCNCEVDCPKN